MECEPYMSERYHFGEPRQEATGSISVLVCEFRTLVVTGGIGSGVGRILGPSNSQYQTNGRYDEGLQFQ
jgi:hypothetical protein